MSDFVHLHVHSDFSLLDGAAKIPNLVSRAKELGMKHLALTDHGVMFGVLPFYRESRKQGINPIVGVEIYITADSRLEKKLDKNGKKYYHLTLLAQDWQGYKNLMYLSSQGFLDGFYSKPRIDEELLFKHSEGLICLSGCMSSLSSILIRQGKIEEAEETLKRYKKVFGDRYFLEIQDHGIEEQKTINYHLQKWSNDLNIPLVATNDSHYVMENDANAQDIVICIGTGKRKADSQRMSLKKTPLYLKSPEEMKELFPQFPESISNSLRIAESCHLEIHFPGPLLPRYEVPQEFKDLSEYLRHLSYEGLKDRYNSLTKELEDRLNYELDTIISMGFSGYFIIVADFIKYARDNNIPVGPGRGSGAGSLVAYALKITDIDPLEYNLLFERFLNPERISMPDFDIDFCYERRGEVIQYVTQKYGEDRVAQIITFGTLKPKAVVKDVARVLDIPFAESNEITKLISDGPKVKLKEELENNDDLKAFVNREDYKELFETALILEGMNRHTSTHAAGIVIGQEPLVNYVPLYRDSKTGAISTQFTMEYLEECGLVKMDFLGLKTLTLLKNTESLIRLKDPTFNLENIPMDDFKTFSMLGEGKSKSIFQFESSGMQNVLREAKPSSVEDLIALNALYRPGPMDFIPQFIEGKKHPKKIKYPHKDLEEVLKPTYGVIVYQEQVMEVAQIIGGFTLGKADILRRAMGKKKEDEMNRMKEEFVQGAITKGYESSLAERIFDILTPFAGYGFNKSHAAAYSVLAYKTAYLKANYPHEFMAANLTNEMNDTEKMGEYLSEVKEMGIEVLPPSINYSQNFFTVQDGKIVYGLSAVKNIGTGIIEEVLRERQERGDFKSLIDFCERLDSRSINKKFIESGIYAGIFDKFNMNRSTMLYNAERLISYVGVDRKNAQRGQISLFGEEMKASVAFTFEEKEEIPSRELLEKEKELLGFYISGHPLDPYLNFHKLHSTLHLTKKREELDNKKTYSLVGIISSLRVIQTKATGAKMAFGKLSSFEGEVEVSFFQKTYAQYESLIHQDNVLLIKGRLDRGSTDIKLVADEVFPAQTISTSYSEYKEEEESFLLEGEVAQDFIKEVSIQLKEGLFNSKESLVLKNFLDSLNQRFPLQEVKTTIFLKVPQEDKILTFSLDPISLRKKEEGVLSVIRNMPIIESLSILSY